MNIKKQLRQIRKGNKDALLELIGFGLDVYEMDSKTESLRFNSEAHANQIADNIYNHAMENGEPSKDKVDFYLLDKDEVVKVINEYLQSI